MRRRRFIMKNLLKFFKKQNGQALSEYVFILPAFRQYLRRHDCDGADLFNRFHTVGDPRVLIDLFHTVSYADSSVYIYNTFSRLHERSARVERFWEDKNGKCSISSRNCCIVGTWRRCGHRARQLKTYQDNRKLQIK